MRGEVSNSGDFLKNPKGLTLAKHQKARVIAARQTLLHLFIFFILMQRERCAKLRPFFVLFHMKVTRAKSLVADFFDFRK
jgi:hypothetical protein